MAGELVQCIECERIFQQYREDRWVCGECQNRERYAARRGATRVEDWKDARKRRDMLKFLALSKREQLKVGRQMRTSASKGKEVHGIPTCSKCGKTSVLDPCRACAPATSGPDDLAYWHGTMKRTKTKRRR